MSCSITVTWFLFFETKSLTEPKARLVASKRQPSSVDPHNVWDIGVCTATPSFMWGWDLDAGLRFSITSTSVY